MISTATIQPRGKRHDLHIRLRRENAEFLEQIRAANNLRSARAALDYLLDQLRGAGKIIIADERIVVPLRRIT